MGGGKREQKGKLWSQEILERGRGAQLRKKTGLDTLAHRRTR